MRPVTTWLQITVPYTTFGIGCHSMSSGPRCTAIPCTTPVQSAPCRAHTHTHANASLCWHMRRSALHARLQQRLAPNKHNAICGIIVHTHPQMRANPSGSGQHRTPNAKRPAQQPLCSCANRNNATLQHCKAASTTSTTERQYRPGSSMSVIAGRRRYVAPSPLYP